MNNPQQTPLEKLISDRRRIQQECTIQEQKLNADFSHIQENAGTLLLSGVSALLFPNTKTKPKVRKATSLYILRKCHPCRLDLPTIFLWHKAYYLLHGMLHAHY